jgi:5'(3')-deoxyribonucleotidase
MSKSRPRIIIDLDNVVYDFVRSMAQHLRYSGAVDYPVDELMLKYKNWSFWEDWNIPKGEFMRWWRLGVEDGSIYGEGPLIPGARNAMWRLSDAEWHIIIATSRFNLFGMHDTVAMNTVRWLREENIPYRELMFTGSKTLVQADAIVDDRADNMNRNNHGATFHFPAAHHTGEFVSEEYMEDYWASIVKELT